MSYKPFVLETNQSHPVDECCDLILDELEVIKRKLRPIIVYKDRIVEVIRYVYKPCITTIYETKYITITKPIQVPCNKPLPAPIRIVDVVINKIETDCNRKTIPLEARYEIELRRNIDETYSYYLKSTELRKPNWSLYTYHMFRRSPVWRPNIDWKCIDKRVFNEYFYLKKVPNIIG